MRRKKLLRFMIPFLLLPLLFGLLITTKDPTEILLNAKFKSQNTTVFLITGKLIMDFNFMGQSIKYPSNTIVAQKGNESYVLALTTIPFTNQTLSTENFVNSFGTYTCTNAYTNETLCYPDNASAVDTFSTNNINYSFSTYLGAKTINGRVCDAILSNVTKNNYNSLISDVTNNNQELLSSEFKVSEMTYYTCIDRDTGLQLESLLTISGMRDFQGLLIDIGMNITRYIDNFTTEVPDSLFNIPYKVMTIEEFDKLVNDSMTVIEQQSI